MSWQIDTQPGNVGLGPFSMPGAWVPGVTLYPSGALGILQNARYFIPMILPPGRYTGLRFNVQAAGSAGSLARVGLYTAIGAAATGPLFLDAGTVAVDSTGYKVATTDFVLTETGYFWMIVATVNTGVAPSYVAASCIAMPFQTDVSSSRVILWDLSGATDVASGFPQSSGWSFGGFAGSSLMVEARRAA